MKKKMCVLMAAVAMLVASSAVCKEVKVKPELSNIISKWEYYTGKKGTSSYKLDWDAFYDRMNKTSDIYRYVGVQFSPLGNYDSNEELCYMIHEDGAAGFTCLLGSYGLIMVFSNTYPTKWEPEHDYDTAVEKWNYYLDLM